MKKLWVRALLAALATLFSGFFSGITLIGQSPAGMTTVGKGFPIVFIEFYLLPSESWSLGVFFTKMINGQFYANILMVAANYFIWFWIVTILVMYVILPIKSYLIMKKHKH